MYLSYCISTVVHWNIPAPKQLATVKKLSMYFFLSKLLGASKYSEKYRSLPEREVKMAGYWQSSCLPFYETVTSRDFN